MTHGRFFTVQDTDVFYHYCTPQAFLLICSNKTIRFSDVYTMNDSMEMQWGYKLWEDFAGSSTGDNSKWDALKSVVSDFIEVMVPLASCQSTQGDILSQWRAYSDDGTGFCIGFGSDFYRALPASAMRVEYGLEEQRSEIRKLANIALALDENSKEFTNAGMDLAVNLLGYKNPAFMEESEVRLVHAVARMPESAIIKSLGGRVGGASIDPVEIKFQMRQSTPSPYVDLSFSSAARPIAEIVLGPKNYAEASRISEFLSTVGFPNVVVRKSTASYR